MDVIPWSRQRLLDGQRNPFAFWVNAQNLNLNVLANFQYVRWLVNVVVGNFGNVNQTVYAAKVDESTKVGHPSYLTFDNVARLQFREDLLSSFFVLSLNDFLVRKDQAVVAWFNFNNLEFKFLTLELVQVFNIVVSNH